MGCAFLHFSKQEVQAAWHMCTVGFSRDVLGSVRQSPKVRDAELVFTEQPWGPPWLHEICRTSEATNPSFMIPGFHTLNL